VFFAQSASRDLCAAFLDLADASTAVLVAQAAIADRLLTVFALADAQGTVPSA
jgi:hypothetical protein